MKHRIDKRVIIIFVPLVLGIILYILSLVKLGNGDDIYLNYTHGYDLGKEYYIEGEVYALRGLQREADELFLRFEYLRPYSFSRPPIYVKARLYDEDNVYRIKCRLDENKWGKLGYGWYQSCQMINEIE